MTGLRAAVRTQVVTADIEVAPGEIVALVGPNGAGKTSLLRALLGLPAGDSRVELAGRQISRLAPQERRIGWLPQAPSLFAHLTARDNVAYPLRTRGLSRSAARARADEWLDRLDATALAPVPPARLSGGQAARVGLARALTAEPDLVLLDEPMAALDSSSKDNVRRMIRVALSGSTTPTVLVTHDPVDVAALADRVVVLERGEVVQTGTASELALAPQSPWVAGLLGQNAWHGIADTTGLVVDGGHIAAAEPLVAGAAALALCEPAAVTLHPGRPEGSARTVLHGPVLELRSLGGRSRVVVGSSPAVIAEVTTSAAQSLGLAPGVEVWAAIKATEVRLVAL